MFTVLYEIKLHVENNFILSSDSKRVYSYFYSNIQFFISLQLIFQNNNKEFHPRWTSNNSGRWIMLLFFMKMKDFLLLSNCDKKKIPKHKSVTLAEERGARSGRSECQPCGRGSVVIQQFISSLWLWLQQTISSSLDVLDVPQPL